MANHCKMFSAVFGAKVWGLSSKHPSFLHEKVRGTLVCIITTSMRWSKLLFLQQSFMSEGHYAWSPNLANNLLMRFLTFGLLWYFDIFAGFWVTSWKATITSGSCMAARTSGSLRISLSPGIPAIPSILPPIPGIPPGKLPGITPGKLPGMEPYWDPDCLLASSSGLSHVLPGLLNPLYSFFDLTLLMFLLILSPMFSNFLGLGKKQSQKNVFSENK